MSGLLYILLALALGEGEAPRNYIITNVNVIPMDEERVLENQMVVITDGRITSISATQIELEGTYSLIPGKDRFLLPGLADMHVHPWTLDDYTLFVTQGVTTVRNLFGSSMHLQWRKQFQSGEVLGPTMFTAGPIIDGKPPIWPGSTVVETAEQAVAAVHAQKKAGYDFLKVYNRLPREAYLALMAEARQEGIPVDGHVPDAVGLEEALEQKQRCIEHMTDYSSFIESETSPTHGKKGWRHRFQAWQHADETKMAAIARKTREAGTWICPTLAVFQKWMTPEQGEEELKLPHMKYVSVFSKNMWRRMSRRNTLESVEGMQKGMAGRLKMVKALHDAGVNILLGTDMGNPYLAAGFSLHEELANLVNAGLTPFEALRAGTANAAEFFGQVGEFGTIVPGARADLLLLEANPLEDIRSTSTIQGVMLRGQWFSRQDLDAKLEALAAKYAPAEGD